jgi:hypothetical protein
MESIIVIMRAKSRARSAPLSADDSGYSDRTDWRKLDA